MNKTILIKQEEDADCDYGGGGGGFGDGSHRFLEQAIGGYGEAAGADVPVAEVLETLRD
ncbi:hypothetical protein LINGRAHAP2_LOCUS2214 [Linum grandiflorum]